MKSQGGHIPAPVTVVFVASKTPVENFGAFTELHAKRSDVLSLTLDHEKQHITLYVLLAPYWHRTTYHGYVSDR